MFWVVTPCRFVDDFDVSDEFSAYIFKINLYREDGGSKFLRNIDKYQQDYRLSPPIRRGSKRLAPIQPGNTMNMTAESLSSEESLYRLNKMSCLVLLRNTGS
jgi:hypothetical protein